MNQTEPRMKGLSNYLDADGLAAQLPGVTKRWVQEYTRRGLIPAVKIGRKYFYEPEAVDAAMHELAA